MRILFIAPRLPLPADTGGKIRTFNILKQLAKNAAVHLVCFSFEPEDKDYLSDFKEIGIEVDLVPNKEPGFLWKVLQIILNKRPLPIAKYYSSDMETILRELHETNDFDAVHVDHLHMSHYCGCFDNVPCVIDEHNVEYKILERCANVEKIWIKKMIYKDQARKMKTFEACKIKGNRACLTVSEDDKKLLMELGADASRGYVVPNGVDTLYFSKAEVHLSGAASLRSKKSEVERNNRHHPEVQPRDLDNRDSSPSGLRMTGGVDEEDAVVFTGSMDWLPNDDAVVYFCEDILPRVWKLKPDSKFYIVGKGASGHVQKLAKKDPRIIVTGRVEDVRTFVARAKVFVVPLRIGGGTRLKILEAMSMKKAVVSTTVGAEGIAYTRNANIVLADTPEPFAKEVVSLLNNPRRRESLGVDGRKLVKALYDWDILGGRLREIYRDVIK